MTVPRIVSADEWLAERKELLAAEEHAARTKTSSCGTTTSTLRTSSRNRDRSCNR